VYYDWMIRHLSRREDFKRSLEVYCEQVWKRALRTGLLAYFLAHEVKGVAPKHALSAGMLLHGGKLFLASTQEGFVDSEAELNERIDLSPLARLLMERQKWGVAQEQISAHSLRYFDVFQSLVPAVRAYREPYCLKGDINYPLASLLYLADAMAGTWRIPADEKDPMFKEWGHPSLKQFKLKIPKLIEVMKSAMTLK
jgi:hypothetical protein